MVKELKEISDLTQKVCDKARDLAVKNKELVVRNEDLSDKLDKLGKLTSVSDIVVIKVLHIVESVIDSHICEESGCSSIQDFKTSIMTNVESKLKEQNNENK